MPLQLDRSTLDNAALAAIAEALSGARRAAGPAAFQATVRIGKRTLCVRAMEVPAGASASSYLEAASRRAGTRGRRLLPLIETGEVDGCVWTAYDVGSTTPLDEYRKHLLLPTATWLRVLSDVARALDEAADDGVFAYEVGPDSVFVSRRGARLADLGTAREAFGEQGAGADPAYVPPEVLRGEPAVARSGVYVFGALLYHLLAGASPRRDTRSNGDAGAMVSLAGWRPDLPPAMDAVVAAAMAEEPARRLRAAGEAFDLARRAIRGELPAGWTATLPPTGRTSDSKRGGTRPLPEPETHGPKFNWSDLAPALPDTPDQDARLRDPIPPRGSQPAPMPEPPEVGKRPAKPAAKKPAAEKPTSPTPKAGAPTPPTRPAPKPAARTRLIRPARAKPAPGAEKPTPPSLPSRPKPTPAADKPAAPAPQKPTPAPPANKPTPSALPTPAPAAEKPAPPAPPKPAPPKPSPAADSRVPPTPPAPKPAVEKPAADKPAPPAPPKPSPAADKPAPPAPEKPTPAATKASPTPPAPQKPTPAADKRVPPTPPAPKPAVEKPAAEKPAPPTPPPAPKPTKAADEPAPPTPPAPKPAAEKPARPTLPPAPKPTPAADKPAPPTPGTRPRPAVDKPAPVTPSAAKPAPPTPAVEKPAAQKPTPPTVTQPESKPPAHKATSTPPAADRPTQEAAVPAPPKPKPTVADKPVPAPPKPAADKQASTDPKPDPDRATASERKRAAAEFLESQRTRVRRTKPAPPPASETPARGAEAVSPAPETEAPKPSRPKLRDRLRSRGAPASAKEGAESATAKDRAESVAPKRSTEPSPAKPAPESRESKPASPPKPTAPAKPAAAPKPAPRSRTPAQDADRPKTPRRRRQAEQPAPASPPRVRSASPDKRIRRRRIAAVGGALLLGSVAGVLLGASPEPEPASAKVVSAAGMRVTIPPDWELAQGSGVLAVRLEGDPGSRLEARLVDEALKREAGAEPVQLGAIQAWRTASSDSLRYAAPTTEGTLLITCQAPPAGPRLLQLCERTASTLDPRTASPLPLAGVIEEEGRLRAAIDSLRASRNAGRDRLARAERPAGQREVARALARSHEHAADTLARISGAEPVEAAVREAATAYTALAKAATSGKGARWNRARDRVRRRDAMLAEVLDAAGD
jgi:hypothetical protein